MTPKQKRRGIYITLIVVGFSLTTLLILLALKENVNVFYTPTEIATTQKGNLKINQNTIRLGGMVKKGSVVRGENLKVSFTVTDFENEMVVEFDGILPDLFREGQGVVAEGKLMNTGLFKAHQVLAKHDENYMPPPLKKALKRGNNAT